MEPPMKRNGHRFSTRTEDWEARARRSLRMWIPPNGIVSPENARAQVCRRISLQPAGRAIAPNYLRFSTLRVERQTQSPAEGIAQQVAQRIALQVVLGVAVRVAAQVVFPVAVRVAARVALSIALPIVVPAARVIAG